MASSSGVSSAPVPVTPPTVYVVGLLATTDVAARKPDPDTWFLTDMLAWHNLFSVGQSESFRVSSTWLVSETLSANLSQFPTTFGDPRSERLKLPTDGFRAFTFAPTNLLRQKFLIQVALTAVKMEPADRLVLILCGHGQADTGNIIIGDGECEEDETQRIHRVLPKSYVEIALSEQKLRQDQVILVSTACYSALWESESWTLLCGAEQDKESVSMPTSGSGEARGGVFTFAAYAEQAALDGVVLPHSLANPSSDRDAAVRLSPVKAATVPLPRTDAEPLRAAMGDKLAWMQGLANKMGGIYAYTQFQLQPAHCADAPRLPGRRFTNEYAEIIIVPSNPPLESVESAQLGQSTDHSSPKHTPVSPLSVSEASELAILATKIRRHHFENSGGSRPALVTAGLFLQSPDLVDVARQRILLRKLRRWWYDCQRANAMAEHLGWLKQNRNMQPPKAEEWPLPHGIGEMTEAEQAGVPIHTEFKPEPSIARWSLAPGSWLAMVWREAGRPSVTKEQWAAALSSTSDIELVDGAIAHAASAITI